MFFKLWTLVIINYVFMAYYLIFKIQWYSTLHRSGQTCYICNRLSMRVVRGNLLPGASLFRSIVIGLWLHEMTGATLAIIHLHLKSEAPQTYPLSWCDRRSFDLYNKQSKNYNGACKNNKIFLYLNWDTRFQHSLCILIFLLQLLTKPLLCL